MLREPSIRWYTASRFASSLANTLLRSSLQWQIFEQTGSAFYLGLIGAVQFVPVLLLSPLAGAIADARDRNRIIRTTLVLEIALGLGLWLSSGDGQAPLGVMFGVIALLAVCLAFEAPAAPEEEAEDGEGWFGDEAPAAEAPPATPAPLGTLRPAAQPARPAAGPRDAEP